MILPEESKMMRSGVLCRCAFQRWAWVAGMWNSCMYKALIWKSLQCFRYCSHREPQLVLKEKCQSFRVSPGEFFCCQVGSIYRSTFDNHSLPGKTKAFRGNLGRGIRGQSSSKFQIWKSSSFMGEMRNLRFLYLNFENLVWNGETV